MEAIVRISGKQYRVAEGDRVTVDRLAAGIGEKVSFDDVLLLTDGPRAHVGTPMVDGAAVTATVVALTRGPKLIVYKYKAKKRYRRTQGSRAEQSLLHVVSVSGPGKARPAGAEAEKAPAAEAEKAQAEEAEKPPVAKAEKAPAAKAEKAPRAERAKPAAPAAKVKAEEPTKAEPKKPAGARKAKPAAKKPAPRAKKE